MTLLNPVEMSRILGIHPKTLRDMAHEGRVPCVRVGRRSFRFEEGKVLEALRVGEKPPEK